MDRKIKILFITSGLSTGGAEKMLFKIIKNLDRERFEPYVISLGGKGSIGPDIEDLGVSVMALNLSAKMPNPFKLLWLFQKICNLNPDVVQTWMYHADLIGGLVSRLAGIRNVIWGIRNSSLEESSTKLSTLLVFRLCAQASSWLPKVITTCSKRAAEVHIRMGYDASKFQIIPNGFEIDTFQPNPIARVTVREELGIEHDAPIVGLIARYDLQKNHKGFIRAAKLISEGKANTHFLLVGERVDKNNQALVSEIERFQLNHCFHMLGLRHDIPRLMASLDVLALSSSYGEAFPNVLGEAMACGVPCVVTDVGDSAEIVGLTGRVVQVEEMQKLAANILDLLDCDVSQKEELSKAARERVSSCYEIQKIVNRYENLYNNISK